MEEKIKEVRELLAGFNCGGCGFDNCDECAKAIVNGKASPEDCLPIDEENIEIITNILKK